MTRFLSILLWTAVFLLIVLAIDQLLVRVPASHPAHVAVATFYRDLRVRALELARGQSGAPAPPAASPPVTHPEPGRPSKAPARPATIEGIIETRQAEPPKPVAKAAAPAARAPAKSKALPPRDTAKEAAPRYVYADAGGELHFAETLAEVPEEYRGKAKRMGE